MEYEFEYNFEEIIKIDGGLKYFHDVFPQSVGFEKKGFDTVASSKGDHCKLSKSKGIWYFKDFKSGDNAINCVNHCMANNSLKYPQALEYLYGLYSLSKAAVVLNKPTVTFKPTTENRDFYDIVFADAITGLKNIAPYCNEQIASEYNFKSIKSYTTVTQKQGTEKLLLKTITATDKYPIYGYDELDFVKIYEPKAIMGKYETGPKKGERIDPYAKKHHTLGTVPARQIYGWQRLLDLVDLPNLQRIDAELKDKPSKAIRESLLEQKKELQLDHVFICSGGSDGLNVASLGYNVIWLNSETAQITPSEYAILKTICKTIYNVPDTDHTGVKMGVKLGLNFLDIKTIWLPEYFQESGKKDIAEFIRSFDSFESASAAFNKLKRNALEFKFWTWNETSRGGSYSLDNVCMNYFLKYNGFYKYVDDPENTDEEMKFLQQKDNVIKNVNPSDVKDFVNKWLVDNAIDRQIQNMILRSVYFSKKALLDLPKKEINTKSGTRTSQIYCFKNKTILVTKDAIVEKAFKPTDNLVWDTSILKRNIKLQQPHFTIKKDVSGNWDIDVLKKDCSYFNILINTSRMFWQKELNENFIGKSEKAKTDYYNKNRFRIDGEGLTEKEIAIQKLQLINKIFCIGYLLHQYKDAAKTFYVFAMDAKRGAKIADANGGSSKSLTLTTLQNLLPNWKIIDGRQDQNKATFMMDGVSKKTPVIFTDDASQFWNHNTVFNQITGMTEANQKGGKINKLQFADSPKQVCASNYVPTDLNSSFVRRLLLMQYSDFYHTESKDYESGKSVKDDFNGATLWDDTYSEENWNNDDNFLLQCLQFYLSQPDKIDPPKDNLTVRNLMQKIGDVQLKWCNDYFIDENLNTFIHTDDVQEDYRSFAGKTAKSAAKMTEGIEEWCEYMTHITGTPYLFEGKKKAMNNPKTGKRGSFYHFYINTTGAPINVAIELPQPELTELNPDKKADDLPF